MTVRIGYHWHLRRVMAERGMFATSDLVPHLAERGVKLSREQVYRLVECGWNWHFEEYWQFDMDHPIYRFDYSTGRYSRS